MIKRPAMSTTSWLLWLRAASAYTGGHSLVCESKTNLITVSWDGGCGAMSTRCMRCSSASLTLSHSCQ